MIGQAVAVLEGARQMVIPDWLTVLPAAAERGEVDLTEKRGEKSRREQERENRDGQPRDRDKREKR